MLNLHRLRILREIEQRGTVSAAARALWMTPPSVSQHMSALEAETGVVLLERVGRGVRLTPAARRLVAHTERMLADMERAEADLASAREEVSGRLAIAAFPTAGRAILVPAAVELMRRHPGLDLQLNDLEQPESFGELRSGNLDIVVGLEYTFAPQTKSDGFEIEHLMSEPVYLALPENHPRANAPVRLEELREERWFAAREPNPCRDAVVRATAYCGFDARMELLACMDYQVILAAVAAGLGVTLVPHLALGLTYPGVAIQPLIDVPLRRRVFAAMRAGSSTAPQVAAGIAALRAAAEDVAAGFHEAPVRPTAKEEIA